MKRDALGMLLRIALILFAVFTVASLAILLTIGPRYGVYLLPPSPQQYAADAIGYMDGGLHASSDEWAAARTEALQKAESVSSYEDAHALLDEAVKVAGGKHSAVQPPAADKGDADEAADAQMTSFELDDQGILYLKVPQADMSVESRYYADPIAFMKENQGSIRGAIVDLRGNTGGDMGPMIAAVSPLLPDGTLLEFKMVAWGYTTPVTLADGKAEGGGSTVHAEALKLGDVPIAILQDERTASSGEATLLAFRGLPNARTFGSPSAGYCSANSMRALYDGAIILLTTGMDVARTGEEFAEDPIAPDVESANALEDARAWLLSEMG